MITAKPKWIAPLANEGKIRQKVLAISRRDKTTWKELAKLISPLAGVHPTICENVLRARQAIVDLEVEMDLDCDFSNAIANMDPSAEIT